MIPLIRQVRGSLTQNDEVEQLEISAKRNLDIASSVQMWTKDELGRIQSRVQDTIKASRAHVDRQEASRIASDETTRTELRRLWQETQQSRYVYRQRVKGRETDASGEF